MRVRSRMIFVDWCSAFLKLFSIVRLLLPIGLLISQINFWYSMSDETWMLVGMNLTS